MQETTLGVFIGRFQPLHQGHCFLIEAALDQCAHLLIIVGSSFAARTIKNPWTYSERKTLIATHFAGRPISILPVQDLFYDEVEWYNCVKYCAQQTIERFPDLQQIKLFGHTKDESSYYLEMFKDWHSQELPDFEAINATHIREEYFYKNDISSNLPSISQKFLENFKQTPEFVRLQIEAVFLKHYRDCWKNSPYPPVFVTTDAVVFCKDHVLLIKRKNPPGQSLYALPGGFLEKHEWIQQGLIRELIEETGISLSQQQLLESLKTVQIFDYPARSLIGRVITHAGLFELNLSYLPDLHAADDAITAEWLPIAQLNQLREQYHDDHYQIITYFLRTWL